jgi:hypothetical protein
VLSKQVALANLEPESLSKKFHGLCSIAHEHVVTFRKKKMFESSLKYHFLLNYVLINKFYKCLLNRSFH